MRSLVPFQTGQLSSSPFGTDMERIFNQFFGTGTPTRSEQALSTPLELSEQEGAFLVRAEVPGVAPDDVVVELEDDVLTISGEKKEESTSEEGGRSYTERRYGSFRRSLQLPASVDPESVRATHAHGVVTVKLLKAAAQRSRRISIEPA